MEYVLYALGGIAAVIVAIAIIRETVAFTWSKSGFAFTALAVMLVVTPGAYAAEKAARFLESASPDSNPRAVDRAREKVRADILRRADLYLRYPSETHNAHRIACALVR